MVYHASMGRVHTTQYGGVIAMNVGKRQTYGILMDKSCVLIVLPND